MSQQYLNNRTTKQHLGQKCNLYLPEHSYVSKWAHCDIYELISSEVKTTINGLSKILEAWSNFSCFYPLWGKRSTRLRWAISQLTWDCSEWHPVTFWHVQEKWRTIFCNGQTDLLMETVFFLSQDWNPGPQNEHFRITESEGHLSLPPCQDTGLRQPAEFKQQLCWVSVTQVTWHIFTFLTHHSNLHSPGRSIFSSTHKEISEDQWYTLVSAVFLVTREMQTWVEFGGSY